jgi:hypothetical protein
MFGWAEIGGGVITVGCGPAAIGVSRLTGTAGGIVGVARSTAKRFIADFTVSMVGTNR